MNQFRKPIIENGEGIILSVRQAGAGSRRVTLFDSRRGQRRAFITHGSLVSCGTGCLLPFALIQYTAYRDGESIRISQYEGRLLFDMMSLSYEDMMAWYFVSEVTSTFFPPENPDTRAFQILFKGEEANTSRNHRVCALITAIQLLTVSGFDPCEEEPLGAFHIDEDTIHLLKACRDYNWKDAFPVTIKRQTLEKLADYINRFIPLYGDVKMKTKI
jgi:hypothetical protein